MKQNDLHSINKQIPLLKSPDLANIFNIYTDKDTRLYYYNMFNSFSTPEKLQKNMYTLHYPLPNEFITQFAYRFYKNVELYWIIAEVNRIYNLLEPLPVAVQLKVPQPHVIRSALTLINN